VLIDELRDRGIPPELTERWKSSGYTELLPIQVEAINKGVLEGKSLLIDAPTSSGKTLVAELAATVQACRGRRTLYLVSFKAIAEEKYAEFSDRYSATAIALRV
jgi:superfamily II helicase